MNMHTTFPVTPIKPPAPYIGGKRILAPKVIERINAVPHKTYVEPFCGMGGVFFRRDRQPACKVINDYSGEVANFFRILQRHYVPFMEMLRYSLTSRSTFERLRQTAPETLTDLERAARFIYLQRTTFGGKVVGQAFGIQAGADARFNFTKLVPVLEDIYERLSGVVIENLDYAECIRRYDSTETLFYLDPPYWGTEGVYGKALFSRDEYVKMATQLASIKGRFILSINDTPEIREIFKAFSITEVGVVYSTSKVAKRAKELIIQN